MTELTSARTSHVMVIHSEAHKDTILSKLDKLRKRDLLCDITLIVEGVQYKAHKALLAASSDYFSLMFTAEDQVSQSVYKLDGMDTKTFDTVLEFIYSARVSLEESTREELLVVARLLQIGDLVKTLSDLSITCPATAAAAADHSITGPTIEQTGEELNPYGRDGKGDSLLVQPKRKRGRPRKNVDVFAAGVLLDEPSKETVSRVSYGQAEHEAQVVADATVGGIDPDNCVTESRSKYSEDADYDPRATRGRQSKRKIKLPVKFKGFKEGDDAVTERREPGKRGRNRKYPNTEPRCEDCGKVFKNHLFLKIHRRTHTGEKPFRCPVCGKGFSQKHTLLVHQRMHTGERPFVCPICSKALSTKNSLVEHMNLHTEQKSFSCDRCGKNFSQMRQLKSHYRVHTGKSLSECSVCHHKFMDAAQLKKHLRTHTGEKPFTCEICGNCFTAKSTLQTHIRIHRGEKPYTCNICNKAFSDSSARRRHVASHSGKKPFTCSSCGLTFARLDNLKTHTKTHNKELTAAEGAMVQEAVPLVQDVLQQYQLPVHASGEQQIQLVVTGEVDSINFVPRGQEPPGLSIIAAAGTGSESTVEPPHVLAHHHGLTLLTQPSGHVQNVALVTQGGGADQNPQIQTISMLADGQMTGGGGGQAEQMHVITLSKEAMEHLQAHHGPPQPLQMAGPQGQRHAHSQQLHVLHHQPSPQLQTTGPLQQSPPMSREQEQHQSQAIRINSQSSQAISISQTTEQIPGHHIQGQTFQIQAGTVSYLYTTGLAPQN